MLDGQLDPTFGPQVYLGPIKSEKKRWPVTFRMWWCFGHMLCFGLHSMNEQVCIKCVLSNHSCFSETYLSASADKCRLYFQLLFQFDLQTQTQIKDSIINSINSIKGHGRLRKLLRYICAPSILQLPTYKRCTLVCFSLVSICLFVAWVAFSLYWK